MTGGATLPVCISYSFAVKDFVPSKKPVRPVEHGQEDRAVGSMCDVDVAATKLFGNRVVWFDADAKVNLFEQE